MQTEREEGRDVDNGHDSRRGFGNGLDRDHVDVVDDDRRLFPSLQ